MGEVAFIHYEDEVSIPYPVCARPGDVFEAIEFIDDPPAHALPGTIAVIQLNVERHKWLHVLEYKGSLYIARLYFNEQGLTVAVQSLHFALPSGNFSRKHLNIIGCVVELYPTGDLEVRIIYHQEGIIFQPQYDLPLFAQKLNKNKD